MIYCGVQLYPAAFKIVALSEGFAFIDEQSFANENQDRLMPWIDDLKSDPVEEVKWFFDEFEFKNDKYQGQILNLMKNNQHIFLVNQRKLINLIQFFYEWIALEEMYHMIPGKAFFLASAVRIFNEQELIAYQNE